MATHTGTICKLGANFGFIKLDGPGAIDMFVIPQACQAFGREVPPVGTRVKFLVVTDSKTGRPRAENCQPADDLLAIQSSALGVPGVPALSSFPPEITAALSPEILAGLSPEMASVLSSPDVGTLLAAPAAPPAPVLQSRPTVSASSSALNPVLGSPEVAALLQTPEVVSLLQTPPLADAIAALSQSVPGLAELLPWLPGTPNRAAGASSDANSALTPEVAYLMELSDPNSSLQAHQHETAGGRGSATGSVVRNNDSFGFIRQDSGEADMFVLPPIPPVGTRVKYVTIVDPKTGRPRAENVLPISEAAATVHHPQAASRPAQTAVPSRAALPVHAAPAVHLAVNTPRAASPLYNAHAAQPQPVRAAASNPEADKALAVLKAAGLPTDMDSVQQLMEQISSQLQGLQQAQQPSAPSQPSPSNHGRKTGTMASVNGNFGFIKQDSGEADMFALPPFPAVGTRVTYVTVVDPKTGRLRAESVQTENPREAAALAAAGLSYGPARAPGGAVLRDSPYALRPNNLGGMPPAAAASATTVLATQGEQLMSGTISKVTDKFAFIAQDIGGPDMFCIPPSCEAFGRELPPWGTRVTYRVVVDAKTGRPRAENVMPG